MSLTPQQQAAAFATGSVAITAGAGTGKTHTLAERYLFHLTHHELTPLQIVAVTFTDKAAAELRARFREEIAKRLPDRHDLMAEFEAAPIGTLHSLAARICQEHPDHAGIVPGARILDDLEGQLWLSDHLDQAMDRLPRAIYDQVPYTILKSALTAFLADPITAEEALQRGPEGWSDLAEQTRRQALDALRSDPVWLEARETLTTFAGLPGDKLEDYRQAAVAAVRAVDLGDTVVQHLETLVSLKINAGKKACWPEGGLDEIQAAFTALRERVKKDLHLLTLELGDVDKQLSIMLPALSHAFSLVRDDLSQSKQQAAVLDFSDLEVHALRALESPTVQQYYRDRWKAFLIDEFQDTNPIQARLLHLLTDGALLTVVGDEQQAIYGFRRADVTVFRSFQHLIQQNGGAKEVLATSFRTHHHLVEPVNQVFAPVLGDLHQPLVAARQDAPHDGPHLSGFVITDENKVSGKRQRQRMEGALIAQKLKTLLDEGCLVHDKKTNTLRPVRYGDIAILSRTWDPLGTYGEALEAAGIPVVHAGGGSLLDTREAKDAQVLLRFLADPEDKLALAAVLRSPFFAVSDRDLYHHFGPESRPTSGRPQGAPPALHELLCKKTTTPPSRLLQLADRLTGYTAVIANLPNAPRRLADWRGFLDLVRQLEYGHQDVFQLVRHLRRLIDAKIDIPRPPLEADNAVSLMSIHASKGLEWPVVIVPDLTRRPNHSSPSVIFDRDLGVAIRLEDEDGEKRDPILYTILKATKTKQEEDEAKRVLYVALTRARDHLILSATEPDGYGLKLLMDGLTAADIPIDTISYDPNLALPPAQPEAALPKGQHAPLIGGMTSGLTELPVTALGVYDRCPKQFDYQYLQRHPGLGEGDGTAVRLGSLTHKALELGIRDAEALAAFDPELEPELVAKAVHWAQQFDSAPVYAGVRDRIDQRELPIQYPLGGLVLNGTVDAVGSDFILDYKTDKTMEPEHHALQLAVYVAALGKERALLAYLRHNTLHALDSAELHGFQVQAKRIATQIQAGHFEPTPDPTRCQSCSYQTICKVAP